VSALEEKHEIPKGLIYALMRQESAFDPQAISPVSATGLMQLMPSTAQHVADELSFDLKPVELTSPEVNLRLGAFYLGKLLKTYKQNPMLAAAAYNAGPGAVNDWLAGGGDQEADVWVARIPYDETRNYVARVIGNLARYQWLEGGDAGVAVLPIQLPKDARAPAEAY
jgi:soluble lytic murein transglycosylase